MFGYVEECVELHLEFLWREEQFEVARTFAVFHHIGLFNHVAFGAAQVLENLCHAKVLQAFLQQGLNVGSVIRTFTN